MQHFLQARSRVVTAVTLALAAAIAPVHAQDALVTSRSLTIEVATRAAQAAMESCRKAGYQVGVAIVDRSGLLQVFLRDRFAGAHTVDVAANKAWTAASFRISTADLANETAPGRPMNAIRNVPRVTAIGGGLPIEAAGAVVGAIGVSGAPGGDADDACAKAGVKAIQADIEL